MTTPTTREDWQCQYRGGHCGAARAVKDDGSLHHLCAEHRSRANLNQRRCKERQRRLQARKLESILKSERSTVASRRQAAVRRHVVLRDVGLVSVSDTATSGMPLMTDQELFAPLLHDLSVVGSAHPSDAAFVDDLFGLIGADLDDATTARGDTVHFAV